MYDMFRLLGANRHVVLLMPYAGIEKIDELIVTFKLVPISGQGFVILKEPDKFPNIFNPV